MGIPGADLSRDQLEAVGVRRISIGSGLARTAYGAMLRAGREMIERGTFTFAEQSIPFAEMMAMFPAGDADRG
jgi:2-methylisocitrate lyase-like PEP mutase family enzyme